jgi:hypothetical protein
VEYDKTKGAPAALLRASEILMRGQEPHPGPNAPQSEIDASCDRDFRDAEGLLTEALGYERSFIGTKSDQLFLEAALDAMKEQRFGRMGTGASGCSSLHPVCSLTAQRTPMPHGQPSVTPV